MRSFLLTLIFVSIGSTSLVQAQNRDTIRSSATFPSTFQKKNELKLNLLYGVLGIGELTYERVLDENQALGASIAFGFTDDTDYKFSLLPYYRMYFGKKPAAGFFIEGNAGLFSYREFYYYHTDANGFSVTRDDNKNSFGAGLAVGGKFLNKNGLFGEVYTGIGRLFSGTDDVFPRLGITLGKRF
ncbi:MAG: hypothetical protein ACO1NU_08910 [Arcticibacter sp.]